MTDCYDIVYEILKRIKDFDGLFYASQVCQLWRLVGKSLMPNLTDNLNMKAAFKITKVRFLFDKIKDLSLNNYSSCNVIFYGHIQVNFSDNLLFYECTNKEQKITINPVREDDTYIIYESDTIPIPYKYFSLKWKIEPHINNIICEPSNFYNIQVIPDDLSWQYFKTGNKYINNESEQVVIGSRGNNFPSTFHSCCAIQLLPYQHI